LTDIAETRPYAPSRTLTGLSEVEATRRLEERGPLEPPQTSRSLASIVRANVFTVFNLILVAAGILTFVFGHFEDALFIGILVANAGIGIIQEWRAKTALDRLAALVAPHATVVRDGESREVGVEEVIEGDLVRLSPGEQLVADGTLERSDGLQLDESILTGESQAVQRRPGDEVRSGSFAVEGSGYYTVTAVGKNSYAERLAAIARDFRHPRSPLERSLNTLLFILVGVMVPLGAMLGYALWAEKTPLDDAVPTAVAAVVTLVPEGLILLTSLTYAVAALRMARRGALAQQLNAIESLASAEVVCLDKTGTLTEAALEVSELLPAAGAGEEELRHALGRFAASQPGRNSTLAAIAASVPGPGESPTAVVPFSSRRRWSAARIGQRTYVLGAPEHFPLGELAERARTEQEQGRRVVAFGTSRSTLSEVDVEARPDQEPPRDLSPLGIVVLSERLRPDARETVDYFLSQSVELKVISGDAPATVAAVAADVGIPSAGPPVDGRELPDDPATLRRVASEASVIGRISPEGKRRVIESLAKSGRYVVMVGDGVNDVPALKSARLAIAQGTGSQMAKSVADIVLVKGDFAAVPPMVGEGRKVLRNLQRVTKLFVTKSVFAAFLILTIGITEQDYPVLPRHLTLVAALTIGIPAFFLALAPSSGPWKSPRFLRDVASFAIPAGTAAGLGVAASYLFAHEVLDQSLTQARTVSVTVLTIVGLYFILVLEASGRKRARWVMALCLVLFGLYCLILAFSGTRSFFELAVPNAAIVLCSIGGAAIAIAGLALMDDRFASPFREVKLPEGRSGTER
jgi:cation-transporting P-type ATPase E